MIVMPVGKDGKCGCIQIDPERIGVSGKQICLSHIKQKTGSLCFHKQAQSVLCLQTVGSGILNKNRHFHFGFPSSVKACRLFFSDKSP